MRGFVRTAVPEVLVLKGAQWTQQWLAYREGKTGVKFPWYEHDKRSAREWLLPLLRALTASHCSFCDAFPLEGQSNEPIEHFRPKSIFPELAYDWTNLYYCCDKCQSSKLDQWSEDLLAPDAIDYRWSEWFEFDYTTGEIRANQFSDSTSQRRAECTIRIYDLRSSERSRRRILELKKWNAIDLKMRVVDEFSDRDYLENSPADQTNVA